MKDATADLELVQRVLRETGVDQTVPAPGLPAYLQAAAERFMDWLQHHAPGLRALLPWIAGLAPAAAVVAGVLVLGTLLVVLVKAVRARRRRSTLPLAAPAPVRARVPSERDRDVWRADLERRLLAGDVAGGLEALWWWFACSIATVRVDPSWTSFELLARCRRTDLAPLARGLDTLLYGAARPEVDDLRRFFQRLDSVLE